MTFGSTDNRGWYKDKNLIPGNQTGWQFLYIIVKLGWQGWEKIQLPLYQLSLISIFIPAKQKFISKYNISRCLVCEKSEKLANHLLEIVKLIKCHLDGCKQVDGDKMGIEHLWAIAIANLLLACCRKQLPWNLMWNDSTSKIKTNCGWF